MVHTVVIFAISSCFHHCRTCCFLPLPNTNLYPNLTGQQWLKFERASGWPLPTLLRCNRNEQKSIKHGLHYMRHLLADEQLAISLYLAVTSLPPAPSWIMVLAQSLYSHKVPHYVTYSQISKLMCTVRAIHHILDLLTSDNFYNAYVQLPNANLHSHMRWRIIQHFIHCFKNANAVACYCNRKVFSQPNTDCYLSPLTISKSFLSQEHGQNVLWRE